MVGRDIYFSRHEVSNSDLSWLKKFEQPVDVIHDVEKAYRFGTLLDAIVTEPHKVDFFKRTVEGVEGAYSAEEFDRARLMHKSYMSDTLCLQYRKLSDFQKVMSRRMDIEHEGFHFALDVRCKWDFWMPSLGWGADLKSTTATTQKQFEEAIRYFDYDRQRAFYMDIAGSDKDMLIGISKVNYQVFKVPIRRGDSLYKSGREKYTALAFKYWMLFEL